MYFVIEISFNVWCLHVVTVYKNLKQSILIQNYIFIYVYISYLDFALITCQVYINKNCCIELGWDTRRNADDSP